MATDLSNSGHSWLVGNSAHWVHTTWHEIPTSDPLDAHALPTNGWLQLTCLIHRYCRQLTNAYTADLFDNVKQVWEQWRNAPAVKHCMLANNSFHPWLAEPKCESYLWKLCLTIWLTLADQPKLDWTTGHCRALEAQALQWLNCHHTPTYKDDRHWTSWEDPLWYKWANTWHDWQGEAWLTSRGPGRGSVIKKSTVATFG